MAWTRSTLSADDRQHSFIWQNMMADVNIRNILFYQMKLSSRDDLKFYNLSRVCHSFEYVCFSVHWVVIYVSSCILFLLYSSVTITAPVTSD